MGFKCKVCNKRRQEKEFKRTFVGKISKICINCSNNKGLVRSQKYTYLIRCLKNNFIKIGLSSDVKKRLSRIKLNKGQCYLIGYCDKNIKSHLHKAYKDYNMGEEWFDLNNDLLSEILSQNIWK